MVQTYWQLGQHIVEQEQQGEARAEYGKALITNLSRYLGDTFGKGFSVANLKNFRQFYLTYPDFDELATHCVANLSWSHVRLIMRLVNLGRFIRQRAGWIDTSGPQTLYLFYPTGWREATEGLSPDRAAKALMAAGYLIPDGNRPQRKVSLPDNTRPRMYCVKGSILDD